MAARAIFEAHQEGLLATSLSVVILDRKTSMVDYCATNSIPVIVGDVSTIEDEILSARSKFLLSWLGLTFNRLLSGRIINAFDGQIFNLHMSLLPLFPGFGAIKKALRSGVGHSGITVHLVDLGMDSGEPLVQRSCPILACDDEITLGKKLFACAIPAVLQVVRQIEIERFPMRIAQIDSDIEQFGAGYCARVFEASTRTA
jgi:phosphoribosylglycinamide formyltransferase-1